MSDVGVPVSADDGEMSVAPSTSDTEFQAALSSAELFRQLLESAPDAIVGIGRDGSEFPAEISLSSIETEAGIGLADRRRPPRAHLDTVRARRWSDVPLAAADRDAVAGRMTVLSGPVRTILVVEDNAADAELVAESLGDAATAPALRVATSGLAALAMLRDGGQEPLPNLILLDLNLPGYSGLQTLADLKTDPALRRLPVIVLTTSKSQDEIDRCYELGAAAVLNKPMRLREYRAMLGAFEQFWLGHVRFPGGG